MHRPTHPQPTKKQLEILYLLYRFRFLSTNHLQLFLNHKGKRRIQKWLKQLTINGYIHCFYDSSTVEKKATPAVYCLETKARQILKLNKDCDELQLLQIYKEKNRSERFRKHCLFLCDIYFLLYKHAQENNETFHFSTKIDLLYYEHFPRPLPDAYIAIKKNGTKRRRYFLVLIDEATPWFAINALVQKYFTYYEEGVWLTSAKKPIPSILFICWDQKSLRYLKKAINTALDGKIDPFFPIYFTTIENLVQNVFRL
jgi:hypothetical protein